MIPDRYRYVFACPYCGALVCHGGDLLSSSVFSQRLWSDGCADQPGAPPPHTARFTKCRDCHHWHWLDSQTLLGSFVPARDVEPGESPGFQWNGTARVPLPGDLGTIPWVNEPGPAEGEAALGDGFGCVGDEEKSLRLMIWRKRADEYRHMADGLWMGLRHNEDDRRLEVEAAAKEVATRTASSRTNLQRLLELLDESVEDERLLKAEAFRQLGEFDRSLALLARGCSGENALAAAGLASLCRAKDAALRVLSWPDAKYLVPRPRA